MKKKIGNWGNFPVIETEEFAPGTVEEVSKIIQEHQNIIPRGNGRCYGDAALADNIISSKKWNKFISFDREKGILHSESGVILSEILETIVPSGWFLPVTPGTKFISVGGALASDVHGKNHHSEGCFSEHVLAFEIVNEKGQHVVCTRTSNTDLFWATVGGMGLSGFITSVKFRLKKIETTVIRQETLRAKNLKEAFQIFEESAEWTYTVAWIDCLMTGDSIGKSVIMRGEHALLHELPANKRKKALAIPTKLSPIVPTFFPSFLLNPFTIKIFNTLFYKKTGRDFKKDFPTYEDFFYPLDAIRHWNRIYGKEGFIQYQMVFPKDVSFEAMRELLAAIARAKNASFLAVLKLFGKNNPQAYNSFPYEGYTLALDFKLDKKLPRLIEILDEIVLRYKGRIYLTKDAMSRPELSSYIKNVPITPFFSHQQKRYLQKMKQL